MVFRNIFFLAPWERGQDVECLFRLRLEKTYKRKTVLSVAAGERLA